MPEIQLMPTGGVSLSNMLEYFNAGACAVGIGGNLIDLPALQAENWEQISLTARAYAEKAQAGAAV
jgi:2-dehydro-3-deoxyphosphogluconate aldolase/(4S)-4-hydroxy-2-oxoglutarate aldolase